MEKKLGDVGEGGGVAGGDAVLGDGGIELAKEVVDVGVEFGRDGLREFGAEVGRFEELKFSAGVEGAEVGMEAGTS